MNPELRVLFDTNVIVSALLFEQSPPGRALQKALARGTILISLPLLTELDEVLSRPKFDRYLSRDERERYLEALVRESTLVEITETFSVCRDPKDDKVLEAAVSGAATHIVSGDQDLLSLSPFREIAILTPRALLAMLESE